MGSKDEKKGARYRKLSDDVVRQACKGKEDSLGLVVQHYENYAKRCCRSIAVAQFGLSADQTPMEDILQDVWCKYRNVLMRKFRDLD